MTIEVDGQSAHHTSEAAYDVLISGGGPARAVVSFYAACDRAFFRDQEVAAAGNSGKPNSV